MAASNYLWKPAAEGGGGNYIGNPFIGLQSNVSGAYILTPSGERIPLDEANEDARENGYVSGFRLPRPASSLPPGSQVVDNSGNTLFTIENPLQRYEDGNAVNGSGNLAGGGGTYGFGQSPFNFPFISAPTFQLAPYNFVDPLETARETFAQNLDIYNQSFEEARPLVQTAISDEFNIIKDFYQRSNQFTNDVIIPQYRQRLEEDQQFNQQRLAEANQFDQQQLLQNIEAGTPGGRQKLLNQVDRGTKLAETGRLAGAAVEGAFDLGLRSRSAERVQQSGLGQNSAFQDDQERKFTALERFGIQQYGNNLESQALSQAFGTFTSQPQRTPISASNAAQFTQPIASTPSISPAQATLQQTGAISNLGTVSPSGVASQQIQQEQFRTNQQQGVFNAQANAQFAADQLNANNQYKAQADNYNRFVQEELIAEQQRVQEEQRAIQQAERERQEAMQSIQAGIGFVTSPIGQDIIGGVTDFVGDLFGFSDSAPVAGDNFLGVESAINDLYASAGVTPSAPNIGSDGLPTLSEDATTFSFGGSGVSSASGGSSAGSLFSSDSSTQASGGTTDSFYDGVSSLLSGGGDAGGDFNAGGDVGGGFYDRSLKNTAQYIQSGEQNYNAQSDIFPTTTREQNVNAPKVNPLVREELNNISVGMPTTQQYLTTKYESGGESAKRLVDSAIATNPNDLATKSLKSVMSSESGLLNLDENGDPKLGIDLPEWNFTYDTIGIGDQPESERKQISSNIENFLKERENLSGEERARRSSSFLSDMFETAGLEVDREANDMACMGFVEGGCTLSNPTANDIDKGKKTADWLTRQSQQFGIFTKNRPEVSNSQEYINAGMRIYNLGQAWGALSQQQRAVGLYTAMDSLIQAYRGGDSLVGTSEAYKDNYKNNLQRGIDQAKASGNTQLANNLEEQLQRADNPDFLDTIFSPSGRAVMGAGIATADAAARISNWDRYNTLGRVGAGVGVARDIDQITRGVNGVTGGDATKSVLGQDGTKALGVAGGALAVAGTVDNWSRMNDGQRAVSGIQSAQVANSTSSALGGASIAGLAQVAGAVGAIYAGYQFAGNFGEMDNQTGATNGMAMGASIGSMVMPGVGTLVGAAIGATMGLGLAQFNSGKDADQKARDSMRSTLTNIGFFNKIGGSDSNFIQLADGSFFDVGLDDFGGGKQVEDPSKMQGNPWADDEGRLRPHDVDYTNDLDMMTSVAAQGLSYGMLGNTAKENGFRYLPGYLTNASTSQTSREFSEGNFKKSMENMRQFYRKAGFESEDQFNAHALSLHQNGVVDKQQYYAMLQGSSMVFNDNFSLAQSLNSTRWQ